jgi:hypothetical protein
MSTYNKLYTQQIYLSCCCVICNCFACRQQKMCTWLGRWHEGGALWQHDYLAAFEDPFDAADNTARTLGTAVRALYTETHFSKMRI